MQKVSVIIPCYNEENYIEIVLNNIIEKLNPYEIIVVDDNSNDSSVQKIINIKDQKIRLIRNTKNIGKGACLRIGFEKAKGDIFVIQDADLEYDPSEIKFLLEPIINKNAEFVIGTRFQTLRARKIGYFFHTVFNRLITFLINLKLNKNFTDVECCYKVLKKKLLENIKLKENGFGIEIELVIKVSKLNVPTYEVPVSYSARTYEEGKKIKFKDALEALFLLFKY